MRVLNLNKYPKSYDKTLKVVRTISRRKTYIPKPNKQEVELERKIAESARERKEFERKMKEHLDEAINNKKAEEIQYYILVLYGIKSDKNNILDKIKARKAN